MKPRNRDFNVFNMSALDLFACALGAFILLAVIALPFFPNTHSIDDDELLAQVEETRAELDNTREELAQCSADLESSSDALEDAEQALAECRRAAQANFLLVLVSWSTSDDVDLHVTDPDGREFSFRARTHSGTDARFEEDNTRGPGNEVWLHPDVGPGEYRIEYHMFNKRNDSGATTVRGAAMHRDGRSALPSVELRRRGQRELAAVIVVDADGSVSLR